MTVLIPRHLLRRTFEWFRACGAEKRECQALWLSNWQSPNIIQQVVHPRHLSHAYGFLVDSNWLHHLWLKLAADGTGIRVQVHTHPNEAYHSSIDDEFPILQAVGFLSLVIPKYGCGPIGLSSAYLCEMRKDGAFHEVSVEGYLGISDEPN